MLGFSFLVMLYISKEAQRLVSKYPYKDCETLIGYGEDSSEDVKMRNALLEYHSNTYLEK